MSNIGDLEEAGKTPSTSVVKKPIATFYHIVLLGLGIKLGGCVAAWHNGFLVGVWGYFIASLVIATGCFCLNFAVAEIVSIISFPGGHFGYVRASLGPFWGYLCGCMGLVESIFFLAVSLLKFGQAFTVVLGTHRAFEYLWWCVGYSGMILFHVRGGITFWNFMSICTILSLISLAIFLIGSIPFMSFEKYAYANSAPGIGGIKGFAGGGLEWFLSLRLPGWFFIGIDLISLTSEEVVNAKKNIPRAMIIVMTIMFVLSMWIQITVAGQAPGLVHSFFGLSNIFPLGHGFSHALHISPRFGVAFSIIPVFASCTGLMYAAGRQLNAMARSGLVPAFLKHTFGPNNTPVAAMLVVSVVGLIGLVFAWFYDPYTMLFRMAIQGGCVTYILVLLSYIQFKTKYSAMTREFVSPLGIPGAVVGIVIFMVVEVALLFVLPFLANWGATIAFLVFTAFVVGYYFLVVRRRQCFSEEEQRNFFKAYIVNANKEHKRRIKQNLSRVDLVAQSSSALERETTVASSVSRITVILYLDRLGLISSARTPVASPRPHRVKNGSRSGSGGGSGDDDNSSYNAGGGSGDGSCDGSGDRSGRGRGGRGGRFLRKSASQNKSRDAADLDVDSYQGSVVETDSVTAPGDAGNHCEVLMASNATHAKYCPHKQGQREQRGQREHEEEDEKTPTTRSSAAELSTRSTAAHVTLSADNDHSGLAEYGVLSGGGGGGSGGAPIVGPTCSGASGAATASTAATAPTDPSSYQSELDEEVLMVGRQKPIARVLAPLHVTEDVRVQPDVAPVQSRPQHEPPNHVNLAKSGTAAVAAAEVSYLYSCSDLTSSGRNPKNVCMTLSTRHSRHTTASAEAARAELASDTSD